MANPNGANTKLTPEVIVQMKEVAALDGSVEEMAYYCGVSKQSIYNWLRDDQELFDEIQRLREKPVLKARQTIVTGLAEPHNAKWYLEKKRKTEFGNAVDFTSDGKAIGAVDTDKIVNELTQKLNDIYKGTGISSDGKTTSALGIEAPNKE